MLNLKTISRRCCFVLALGGGVVVSMSAFAGPPFSTLQGVGGGGLNPTAFVANPIKKAGGGLNGSNIVGKPQFGYWHISLPDSSITWDGIAADMSFYNRLEVGLSHTLVNATKATGAGVVNFQILTAKLQLIKENQLFLLMPAISAGILSKNTDSSPKIPTFVPVLGGSKLYPNNKGEDYYIVASENFYKNVGLPLPVSVTVGERWTKGYLIGFAGYGTQRASFPFGSIGIGLPAPSFLSGYLGLGVEYLGSYNVGYDRLGRIMKNHSIYGVSLAWMPTPKFTVVVAYLNTGPTNLYEALASGVNAESLGAGWGVSLQYQF